MNKKFLPGAGLVLALIFALKTLDVVSAGEGGHENHPPIAAAGGVDPHAQHAGESKMITVGAESGKTAPTPEELAAEEKARRLLYRPGGGGSERQAHALLQRCAQRPGGADQFHLHQLQGRLPHGHPEDDPGARRCWCRLGARTTSGSSPSASTRNGIRRGP